MKCTTLSKHLLAIFMFRLLPAFCPLNMNVYLSISSIYFYTSPLNSSNKTSVFFFIVYYVFAQKINTISLQPKLVCPIHYLHLAGCQLRTRGGVWEWQVGRPPQAPLLRGPRASGLRVCQAIFSGKLEMLIHAPFKILLQGQIP